jgi:large conductance mechanosensitive channel
MLAPRSPGWIAEFRAFIMRGNVVDLAVGIIIGAAFTGVVSSLVQDVFNPVLGLLSGGIDFSNVFVALNRESYATLEDARKAGAPTLNIGLFINAIIQGTA